MDRFAFFVDAGYVYAAGGMLCHGTKSRVDLELNFLTFTQALAARGAAESGIEHLRTYWYDGATDGVPTLSHQQLARLRGIKLRLGLLSQSGQKGVDSLVVRDLMTLSRNSAIATAFVLSGDEDLRQGIVEAQDCGVKVVLVGIEPCAGNQAESLLRDADDHISFDGPYMSAHLTLRTGVPGQPVPRSEIPQTGTAGPLTPTGLGKILAEEWIASATPEDLAALAERRRNNRATRIPVEIDRELLARGRTHFGAEIPDDARKQMRDGFWSVLSEATRN